MSVPDLVRRLNPLVRDAPIADLPGRVDRFRKDAGGQLPADYEAFLLADGHVMFFPDNVIAIPGLTASLARLNSLYGVDDHPRTLFTALETYRDRLPSGHIAIGDCGGGGDLIVLDVAGSSGGSVFRWNHEREVDAHGAPVPMDEALSRLGESFTRCVERTELVDAADVTGVTGARVRSSSLRF